MIYIILFLIIFILGIYNFEYRKNKDEKSTIGTFLLKLALPLVFGTAIGAGLLVTVSLMDLSGGEKLGYGFTVYIIGLILGTGLGLLLNRKVIPLVIENRFYYYSLHLLLYFVVLIYYKIFQG